MKIISAAQHGQQVLRPAAHLWAAGWDFVPSGETEKEQEKRKKKRKKKSERGIEPPKFHQDSEKVCLYHCMCACVCVCCMCH